MFTKRPKETAMEQEPHDLGDDSIVSIGSTNGNAARAQAMPQMPPSRPVLPGGATPPSNTMPRPRVAGSNTMYPPAEPQPPRRHVSNNPAPAVTPQRNLSRDNRSTASHDSKRLIVGQGIELNGGDIKACQHLLVEGTVEASLSESHELEVVAEGLFRGTAEVENATIAGTFEGEITVRNCLTVTSTAAINGTIIYGDIEVERGAQITGQCSLIGQEPEKPRKNPNVRSK